MKRIAQLTFSFAYVDQEDSQSRLALAYSRIFALAKQRMIDIDSTQKYSKVHESNKREENRVSDDRGVSREAEGEQSDTVPNGSEGQDTGCEIREVMEGQQSDFGGFASRQRD